MLAGHVAAGVVVAGSRWYSVAAHLAPDPARSTIVPARGPDPRRSTIVPMPSRPDPSRSTIARAS